MNPVEIEFLVKNNTRQGLSGVSGGIDGVEKEAAEAQKKVQALEAEIARLNKTIAATPTMDQTENIRQIEALKKQLEELQKTTKQTSLIPPDAPAVQRTYNGLNMSIQQIAREMPTLAMGPQMFFMAISNNLPIFADSVKRAREEYEMLIKSGQKGTPVWKQIIKSLFSWQTALTTGIMLLVMYGKEIGNWISGLFGATDAVEQNREAIERRLEVEKQANAEALKTQFNIRTTMAAIKQFNGTKDEEKRKIEELNTKYGETFGYYDTLSEWYDTLKSKAEEYIKVMFMQAKAQSLISAAVKADEKVKEIEAFGPEEYRPFFGKGGKLNMFFGGSRFNQYGSDAAEIEYRKALDEQKKIRDEALADAEFYQKRIQQIQEDNGINHVIEGSVKDLENTIAIKRKALKNLTNKADYDAALAEIKVYEDKLEAITGGKKKSGELVDVDQSRVKSIDKLSDMELAARQRIEEQIVELMEEGYDKQRAEAELNFRKETQRINKEEQERLALYDKLKASGAQISPNSRSTIIEQAATQRAQAAQLLAVQLAEIDQEESEDYEKLLQKYETYQQGRLRIAQQYDADIARLAEDPRNQAVAEAAKQKALEEFDVKFASQFPQFETFANRIVRMSVEDLRDLLTQAQDELDKLEASNPEDQTIGVLRAKIAKLEEQLARTGASEELAPDDNSINRWKDLHDVLRDANEDLEQIGQQVGGTAGEILQLAGRISSSIITMIGGIQTMASSAAASMSSVEKASVVLTIISTVVQAATAIASLFKGGETSLERNLRLAREFNEELRIMKERSKINSDQFDTIFGERLYDRYRQNVDVARKALERLEATYERIRNRGQEVYNEMEVGSFDGLAGLNLVAKTWESEAESIANMQVQTRHSTWFRSAKYQSLGSLLPELFDNGELNMEALRKFVEEGGENFQHLSASNQEMLRSMVDDWELYEEAVGSVNDYLTSIFGELGNTLTDALVDAFENGTNAANTFVESVGQSLRELAKNMIYSMTLGKVFEKAQQQIDELNRSDMTDEERFAGYVETMKDLIAEGLAEQTNFKQLWEQFREIASDQGLSIDSTDSSAATVQTGKPGAIETVTQESFSRVEGLVTSIQIHAANIDASMDEGIVPTLGKALDELHGIRINTDTLPLMYTLLQKFDREGIKVK